MKAYKMDKASPVYGSRIFIPYEHANVGVHKGMNNLCVWNQYDKDTGKCLGWEFSTNENYIAAQDLLKEMGFTILTNDLKNHKAIWG